jgi:hypothetical protein
MPLPGRLALRAPDRIQVLTVSGITLRRWATCSTVRISSGFVCFSGGGCPEREPPRASLLFSQTAELVADYVSKELTQRRLDTENTIGSSLSHIRQTPGSSAA